MKNYVQPGNTLTIPAPAGGTVSGKPVVAGSLRGFATATVAEGLDVAIGRVGVYSYAKATGAAWAVGDKVYYDAAADKFTKTDVNNTLFGFAAAAALAADTIGYICLGDTL